MSKLKAVICPYCGHTQHVAESCRSCGGRFDPDSRKATRAEMGAWFVRDPARPFRPGCSHETVRRLIQRGKIDKYTILRGPTTRQFWTVARRVPGVAHLLGYCHACGVPVDPADDRCARCRASFVVDEDRDRLGVESNGAVEADDDGFSIADLLRPEALRSPGRGGQLSAFVDDDALHTGGHAPDRHSGPVRPRDSAAGADADRAFDREPDDPIGRITLETLERSLRRTVDRQQRAIRTLGVVIAVLAIGFVWAMVTRGTPSAVDTPERSPAAESVEPTEDAASEVDESIDDRPDDAAESDAPVHGADDSLTAITDAIEGFDPEAAGGVDAAQSALETMLARLEALVDGLSPDDPRLDTIDALRERIERRLGELVAAEFFGSLGGELDEHDADR